MGTRNRPRVHARVQCPRYEVADIFRCYGDAYREGHRLSPEQDKALRAIANCRTEAMGVHVDACDHCDHTEISYNSCRNRNCPKCRASQRSAWLDARELELLPIQYFHIVFTLPEALLGLARYNRAALYNLLCQTAASTLQRFADQLWGGKLGIILVHTWGQTLNDHPHVHCIVTGGALKPDASAFVRAPKNYLFPIRARDETDKTMILGAAEFIRRFLSHIPPKGFRRIHYYGFLANGQRRDKLTVCRRLLGLDNPEQPYIADLDAHLAKLGIDPRLCPHCGVGRLHAYTIDARRDEPPRTCGPPTPCP